MAERAPDERASIGEAAAELSYLQQLYQGQYEELSRSVNTAIQELNDFNSVKETLDRIDEIKDRNMLSQIGSGAYIHCKADGMDRIVINVGANYFVEKDIDDAKQFIAKMAERQTRTVNALLKSRDEIEGALVDVSLRLERLANRQ